MNRRQTNPLHHVLEQKEVIRVVKLMTCVSNHCSLELFWGIDHHLSGLRTRTRAAAAARIWWTAIYCSCLTAQGCVCTEACWAVFLIGFDRPSMCVCGLNDGYVLMFLCVSVASHQGETNQGSSQDCCCWWSWRWWAVRIKHGELFRCWQPSHNGSNSDCQRDRSYQ